MKNFFLMMFVGILLLNSSFAQDIEEGELELVNDEILAEESAIADLEQQIKDVRLEIKNRKETIRKLRTQVRTSTVAQKRISSNAKKALEKKERSKTNTQKITKWKNWMLEKKERIENNKVNRIDFETERKAAIKNQTNKMKNYSRYFRNKFGTRTTIEFESTESE